jgi:hypothetical protein
MTSDDWKTLRFGDRIRFVAMPTGFSSENCHEDTLEVYRTLIARRRGVRICFMDEFDMPWIRFRVPDPDGGWEWHSLLINHDGWVRVKQRS